MVAKCHTPTLLQIFCELLLYCQVIFKNMRVADYFLLSKEQLNEEMSTWRQSFIQYFDIEVNRYSTSQYCINRLYYCVTVLKIFEASS